MTAMTVLTLFSLACLGAAANFLWRARNSLITNLTMVLEISGYVRLTLEDLRSRDPMIEEAVELTIVQLGEWEKRATRELKSLRGGR